MTEGDTNHIQIGGNRFWTTKESFPDSRKPKKLLICWIVIEKEIVNKSKRAEKKCRDCGFQEQTFEEGRGGSETNEKAEMPFFCNF